MADERPEGRARRYGAFACDVIGVSGLGLAAYGVWLVYEPAAFIIGGLVMVAAAALLTRGGKEA